MISFVKKIKERPIVERRNSELADEILVGIMAIVTTILKAEPTYRLELGKNYGVITELYHNCLFAMKAGPSPDAPPKCKAKLSRVQAFNLLVELCRDCTENFMELLQYLLPHHPGGVKLQSWEYHPGSDDKALTGYVGLRNLGNTCYMNSLFQQFFMIPELRYGMLSIEEPAKAESILYQLQSIFFYNFITGRLIRQILLHTFKKVKNLHMSHMDSVTHTRTGMASLQMYIYNKM
jgi:hypothetical protein